MALRFAFVLLLSVYSFSYGMAIPAFPVEQICGHNAVFKTCGSACVPDCANPKPSDICTFQCIVGCFCNEGFLKNAKGECVRPQECEAQIHDIPMQIPQTVPQCKENEIFVPCGSACAPTCANPHPSPVCTKNCVVGCFCKPGYLKNEQGVCVAAANCGVAANEAIPMQPQVCGDNEEFRQCKGCDGTCKNPNPLCPRICIPGCACKQGHLRSENGKCIETRECSAQQVQPESLIMPMPPQVCGENEEFRQCKGCEATCKNRHPICPHVCIASGCVCKQGHVRSENGKCIETRECSAQQVQPESLIMPMPPQDCPENEEFRECKGCEATCKNRHPICPQVCIADGCVCKEGHVRSVTGKCVRPEGECTPELKTFEKKPVCGQNEVFKPCGTACPATCANPNPSPVCTRNCVIGCFCKEGYLKNAKGVCVAAANCDAPVQANIAMVETSIKSVEGKCATDREVYVECGTQLDCLASCGTPLPFLVHGYPQLPPRCLERNCTPGCVCMKPYVRHSNGQCVERQECERKNPFADASTTVTTTPSH